MSRAPRVSRAEAAHALGADPARLEDALAGRAQDARDAQDMRTGSGLREDQAAAALAAPTDGQLVSVLNAPAGSGKTRALAEAARIWAEAGLGPVIGITPSQSARNTLAAGVRCAITRRSSWVTCQAGAAPAARSRSARAPCW